MQICGELSSINKVSMFCFHNRENLDASEHEDEDSYNLRFGHTFDNRNDTIPEHSTCCPDSTKFQERRW